MVKKKNKSTYKLITKLSTVSHGLHHLMVFALLSWNCICCHVSSVLRRILPTSRVTIGSHISLLNWCDMQYKEDRRYLSSHVHYECALYMGGQQSVSI